MEKTVGFLKLSQKFRENEEYGKYLPILDKLDDVASKNHNHLPHSFSLEKLNDFSKDDTIFVLSKIYPEIKYSCQKVNDDIFCVRS